MRTHSGHFAPGNRWGARYKNLADRILSGLALDNGCWLWTRSLSRKGYPRMTVRIEGRPTGVLVHRVAFEMFANQVIPEGMTVDHKCCRRSCCNPEHLELVSREKNTKLMWQRRGYV